jgi:oligoendopeptidase F
LYASVEKWTAGLRDLESILPKVEPLRKGFKAEKRVFLATLVLYSEYLELEESLGSYAHLRVSEDEGDSQSRGRYARFVAIATKGQGAWSWLTPAIQELSAAFLDGCLKDPEFAPYAVFLGKLLRFKPHVLSDKEERLLALQAEANQTAHDTFGILTNVDLDFGSVATAEGKKPLSQSTFVSFMRNPDRAVRKRAYQKFYGQYDAHRNTLASLYSGSVALDKYQAEVRNFASAREQALFPDKVPTAVYDNLVSTVNANLPVLHEYYELRRRALGLDELRHYDVYVPFVKEVSSRHSYDEAVELVSRALAPLGDEYVGTLRHGLLNGWVDKYENKGKRSGAFSAGSYTGEPYILLNFKEEVLRDVFTLAHEGGHSMHSWYSVRNNPFMCYSYTIFEAEVASTFNEQLLFKYLYSRTASTEEKASLLSNRVDETLGTLFRQTMFAEYEATTHALVESGEPLTLDVLRGEYRKLLVKYFGPAMKLEKVSDLEGLRIPHFYRPFYVYKYATGISASIALSKKVIEGGPKAREAYFSFLKSGGSTYPIDSLKLAGVDMSTPAPVEAACASFAADVGELKRLLKV